MNFLKNLWIEWRNSKYIPTKEQEECEHEWDNIEYFHYGYGMYCPKCKLEKIVSSKEYFKINSDKRYKERLERQKEYEEMPERLLENYKKLKGDYHYEN